MNEQVTEQPKQELDHIYDDASYFIDAITSGYGFYSSFIHSVEQGKTGLSLQHRSMKKTVESAWVDTIEASLPALDSAMRRPSVGIEEREEILPIEFSRHINQKSLQHLSQHTDYISHIENGMVRPSKILNVYHEETNKTYENKFLNTLIDRLLVFVDRRYATFKERGLEEDNVTLRFSSSFRFGAAEGKINLSIESASPAGKGTEEPMVQRVERLYKILLQYKDSQFVRSMEGAMITPPVMRTNAISKNKYLSQCLDLWDFIESYDQVGWAVESDDLSQMPDKDYIEQMYSLIALQYLCFTYRLNSRFKPGDRLLRESRSNQKAAPELITDFQAISAKKYTVFNTEMRRIMNVYSGQQRPLSQDEAKVRDAVAAALREDKRIEAERTRQQRGGYTPKKKKEKRK